MPISKERAAELTELCRVFRIDVLTAIHAVQSGHPGGSLSVCEILTLLYQERMNVSPDRANDPDRDRLILSKGHAAAVTSLSQAIRGCYPVEEIFNEYATDFGRFGMHSCNLINPYVEVSTGALGHGLPIANGIAEALKKKGSSGRVYVVMGDGETDEGSIWEAAMLAHQLKLGNLIAFVDRNRLQLDGKTEDELQLEPYTDKWKAFSWNVIEVDGHDIEALVDVVDELPAPDSTVPTVIICNTVKGHGISFMENQIGWHTGELSDEDYEKALVELEAAYERGL